ncbi:hypothetical protein GOV05_04060 [Candidatus Woesearchaeota archaeon]|nr:hypothetical protein [Candidatus Woesearchaeota archaeon]
MGLTDLIKNKGGVVLSGVALYMSLSGCVGLAYLGYHEIHQAKVDKKRERVVTALTGLPYDKDIVVERLNSLGFETKNSTYMTHKEETYYILVETKGLSKVELYDLRNPGIIDKNEVHFKN